VNQPAIKGEASSHVQNATFVKGHDPLEIKQAMSSHVGYSTEEINGFFYTGCH
jgi:hypothetical protein